ncbi:MAG: Gfo/Idh/MocA family protein [Promethearchaeota archaeon]
MEAEEPLKIGIIGCGMFSNLFKFMAKKVDNIKIIAATDVVFKKAKSIGGKNHAYIDSNQMYNNEDIDAVYIATPHYLHMPQIKQAFEAGKHILCEKPVACSVEDARKINELDKKFHNLKLGFDYNYRYDYVCHELASAIQNGHLDKIYYANCNIFFSRDEAYFKNGMWRTKWDTSGGGTLLTHGSHIIDIMIWALGEPISVMGKIDTLKFPDLIEVEDVGFGIVEFENEVHAQINCACLITPPMSVFQDKVELQIFGQKGYCLYNGPWPSSLKWKGVEKYSLEMEPQNKDQPHLVNSIKAFADWVLHDIPYFNTTEESSKVLRLIKALYKSSETEKKEIIEKL